MAGFGGAVKLTGESEYKRALSNITQSLREVDSELKLVASQYDKNDSSEEALTAQSEALNKKLDAQREKVKLLSDNYKDLESKAEANKSKHEALRKELETETSKLEALKTQAGENTAEYKEQASKVATLSSEYKNSVKNIENQEGALSRARTELNKATSEMNNTERAVDDLGKEFSDTATDAGELEDAAKKAGDAAESSAKGGWTVLKGVLADLASTAISSVLGELRSVASEAIDASDSLDKFATTMSFAGYDSATIEQAQSDVKTYADKTVYDLNTIANTSAQLAANGIDDFQGLTEAAGNLNAVAGGNADTFRSVSMVLTQTAGAGKLTTENWNQLANAIPGASGVLQQALLEAGAYTGDFREAMADGEITADEFNEAIKKLGQDPVAVEASQSVSTFEGAIGNLRATAVNGFMEIYETIGKENITEFITGITDFVEEIIPPLIEAVEWFIDNLPAIAPILGAIAGGLVALMVAQKINAVVTAFQAWRAATEGMTIAQAALNTVMNANPIMVIVTLLGTLVGALVVAYNTNDEFKEKINEAWDSIKETFDRVWSAIETFFTTTLPGFFKTARDKTVSFFTEVLNKIKAFPGQVQEQLTTTFNNIKTFASNTVNKAKTTASDFVSNMVNKIRELPGKLWDLFTSAIGKVSSFATDIGSKALSAGANFVSNLINKVVSLPGDLWNKLLEVIGKAADFARDFAQKAIDAGQDFFDNIIDKVDDIPGEMLDVGRNIVEGIWDGIKNAKDWLLDKVGDFADDVIGGVKGFFGINSPSRVFRDEVGVYLAEGIGVGFSDAMREVSQEMEEAIPTSFNAPTIDGADYTAGDTYGYPTSNTALVSAIIDALEGVDVKMDDVTMGRFVRKTVTDAIYT
jgi:tape measure domain-containing protein